MYRRAGPSVTHPHIPMCCSLIEDTRDGWRQRLKILAGQLPKQIQPLSKDMRLGREYFQMNWEPVVACPHEVRALAYAVCL